MAAGSYNSAYGDMIPVQNAVDVTSVAAVRALIKVGNQDELERLELEEQGFAYRATGGVVRKASIWKAFKAATDDGSRRLISY